MSNFFGDFPYCWTFENSVSSLQCCWTFGFCLLLNLWDSSFTYLFAAEPLKLLYCWTFEIVCLLVCLLLNVCIFFTADPLRLSNCCCTFEIPCWSFYNVGCSPSHLEAHTDFFRLSMKEKFYIYLPNLIFTVTIWKKVLINGTLQ